jgi:flagellar basal-body rod modification protein FlgD
MYTANPASAVMSALAPKNAATAKTDSTGSTSSATDSSGATITANDFLTLLVSEMKNQDPTQPTDPNQYISQLVDVNSLQQLIQINQGINDATGTSTTTAVPKTANATNGAI